MSSNAKAPLTSTLFDDEAPTTQRRKLPDAEELELDVDVECEMSAPFLDDLVEDDERPTFDSLPPRA